MVEEHGHGFKVEAEVMMPCLRKSHEKQPELLKKVKKRRCQSISTRSEILRMDKGGKTFELKMKNRKTPRQTTIFRCVTIVDIYIYVYIYMLHTYYFFPFDI